MKRNLVNVFLIALITSFAALANASGYANSTAAAGGYDVVSYHLQDGPLLGNGHHVSNYKGVTYLFANKQNLKNFEDNPAKFVPAYGGYCAFGVSKGKKFYGDPTVWKVVDGKLYLNLDKKIQKLWQEDVPGNITEANKLWADIQNVPAAEL